MDNSKETDCLKRIERFVIDDGQIATYKWVSRTMDIHVNLAKQLLQAFLSTRGKSYTDISATYLLSGRMVDGSLSVVIVNDSELEKAKSSFIDVVSEHVYSIQNCKSLSDYQMLYAVDTFENTSSWKSSPINCSLCTPRVEADVVEPIVLVDQKSVQTSIKPTSKEVPLKNATKPVSTTKKDTKEDTKLGVDKSKVSKIEKPPLQKGNSISSMFSAQQKKTQSAVTKPLETKELENATVVVNSESSREKLKPTKEKSSKPEKKKPQKKSAKKVEEEVNEKKRKRIRVLSDSEDSDQDRASSPEPEPELELPPTVNLSDDEDKPASPHQKDVGHSRKKRKIVEKQEVDDQGYIQTTKEFVFETDSEPEPESAKPVEKKTPQQTAKQNLTTAKKSTSPKKGKGKAAPSDGKKQPTLLSFFKKT